MKKVLKIILIVAVLIAVLYGALWIWALTPVPCKNLIQPDSRQKSAENRFGNLAAGNYMQQVIRKVAMLDVLVSDVLGCWNTWQIRRYDFERYIGGKMQLLSTVS